MHPLLLTHHAHLLIGGVSVRTALITHLGAHAGVPAHTHPDFFDREYENLTIDDARELKSMHGMRPTGSTSKKIFVITTPAATSEAQNALLKLLEEPAEYAHFFLIVPSAHVILPTIRSRMREIVLENADARSIGGGDTEQTELREEARKFLRMSSAKRLEVIKKLVEDIAKEKKTKQDAIHFLNAIQAIVYEEKGVKEGCTQLEAIERAQNYIHDRAPSLKMLLEYVALRI